MRLSNSNSSLDESNFGVAYPVINGIDRFLYWLCLKLS